MDGIDRPWKITMEAMKRRLFEDDCPFPLRVMFRGLHNRNSPPLPGVLCFFWKVWNSPHGKGNKHLRFKRCRPAFIFFVVKPCWKETRRLTFQKPFFVTLLLDEVRGQTMSNQHLLSSRCTFYSSMMIPQERCHLERNRLAWTGPTSSVFMCNLLWVRTIIDVKITCHDERSAAKMPGPIYRGAIDDGLCAW